MKQIVGLPPLILAAIIPASAFAGVFGPSNYSECIIARMADVKSDPAAQAVARQCLKEYGSAELVEQGSGRGILSYKSGDECAAKKSTSTPSRVAAIHIIRQCQKLYDAPTTGAFQPIQQP